MPSGVQLFSLFFSHQELLDLITEALGTAPRLGPYLAKNSSVLDALLDPDFLTILPTADEMAEELTGVLKPLSNFEEILDQSRRWGKDHAFRIGLQVLRGTLRADAAGKAFAELANVIIAGLLPAALADVEQAHGKINGSGFAVVAMGSLGGWSYQRHPMWI